ncbi:MAG TPA: hypothetical protein VNF06_02420 [Candidatus Aquilonibacter sp.]|nr:hypothetical protein [Candidatus Aquilonibacter sp.]
MTVTKKKLNLGAKNLRRDSHLKVKGLNPKWFLEAVDSYAEIKDMKVGSSGYIGPWALIATQGDDLYLNTNVNLGDKSDDVSLKITRNTARSNGFSVELFKLTKKNYSDVHHTERIENYLYHMSAELKKNVVMLGNIGPLLEVVRKGKK